MTLAFNRGIGEGGGGIEGGTTAVNRLRVVCGQRGGCLFRHVIHNH